MTLLPLLSALALTASDVPAASGALTLDDALAEAARANPDLAVSRNQVALSGVDVYGSWAGVLPRLDLTATVGRDFFPTPPGDAWDHALGLTLQLPIYDGARSWNAIRRAKVVASGADRSLDESRLTVAFEVTRRFYEVVKARERLRVLIATVERSEEFARRAEALFEAGRGSRLDALAARGNVGSDRIAVEQARARLDQARAELAAVLGRSGTGDVDAVAPAGLNEPGPALAGEPPTETTLLATARRSRPLLAAQTENVRTAELDERIAHGAWWPVLLAQASYSRVSPVLVGSDGVWGDPSRAYAATAQLVLQWNLFAGRQTVASEQRAAVSTERARTQVQRSEVQVATEIARARSSVLALQRSEAIAAENLVHARAGVAVARERLQAGAANQLEVRDANLKLTQAELDLLDARIDQRVARADLNRAVGAAL